MSTSPESSDTSFHPGRRISALELVRKEILKVSRERFVGQAGISASTLQDIELHGTRPHRATAAAIAAVIGVDPQWVLDVVAEHRAALIAAAESVGELEPNGSVSLPRTESVTREPDAQEHEGDVHNS